MTLLTIAGALWLEGFVFDRGRAHERALCQAATAEALASRERALRVEYDAQIRQADDAVRALRAEKKSIEQRAKSLALEIAHVTETYRPTADAPEIPLPQCVFTDGFVRLYNGALGAATLPTPGAAAGTDGETGATALAEANGLVASGVRQADILHHMTAYGARCQAIEAQLNRLIDHLDATQQSRQGTP